VHEWQRRRVNAPLRVYIWFPWLAPVSSPKLAPWFLVLDAEWPGGKRDEEIQYRWRRRLNSRFIDPPISRYLEPNGFLVLLPWCPRLICTFSLKRKRERGNFIAINAGKYRTRRHWENKTDNATRSDWNTAMNGSIPANVLSEKKFHLIYIFAMLNQRPPYLKGTLYKSRLLSFYLNWFMRRWSELLFSNSSWCIQK